MTSALFPFKWIDQAKIYLKYLTLILLSFVLLFNAFAINNNSINPTQTGQFFFLLKAILLLLSILIFTPVYTKAKFRIKISTIDILAFAFVAFIIVYAQIQNRSILPINILDIFSLSIIYLGFRLSKGRDTVIFLFFVLISGIAEAIYGNVQLYGFVNSFSSEFKMTGSFFNPAPFAGFLVIILPIALGVYIYKNALIPNKRFNGLCEIVSIICLLTIILVVPASDSRAAWFAGVMSCLFVLLSAKNVARNVLIKFKLLFYLGLVVISCIVLAALYFHKKNSANGRLLIWKIGIPMFTDSPLIGHGPGKFKAGYMDYQAAYFENKSRPDIERQTSDNVQYAYNEFIHIAIEFGLVGLLFAVLLIVYAFKLEPRKESDLKYLHLARGGLLAYIVFSFFSYSFEIIPMSILALFCLSVIANYTKTTVNFSFNNLAEKFRFIYLLAMVVGLCISLTVWDKISKYEGAFYSWKKANNNYSLGYYNLSLLNYRTAYSHLESNGLFLSNFGKALSMTAQFDSSKLILNQSRNYLTDSFTYLALGDDYDMTGNEKLAEACYQKAISMTPSHFYPMYCLSKLYFKTGQNDKALVLSKRLLNTPVKIESEAVKQMKNEIYTLINTATTKKKPI